MAYGENLKTIEAALQTCQNMADHYVLFYFPFFLLSVFVFAFSTMWRGLSSVGGTLRSLGDERGEESADERPGGR